MSSKMFTGRFRLNGQSLTRKPKRKYLASERKTRGRAAVSRRDYG